MSDKILVLFSGGIDSTTCLAIAIDEVGASNVETLNISYGQKHNKEIENAKKITEYYGVNYTHVNLAQIMKYSNCPLLVHSSEQIKHESYAEQLKELGGEGTVDTYVPFRNGLMLATAASYAISKNCNKIYYGAHADDGAGRAYPDCTPEFSEAMNTAIYEGSGRLVKMVAPLINFNKSQVIAKGLELDAPYQYCWSCYEGGEKQCGTCGTCIDRINGFKINHVKDPVEYQVQVDWVGCEEFGKKR